MSATGPTGLQAFPSELDGRDRWLNPFPWYREMRESAPIRYDHDRRCWDVFRYADVKRVLDDDATFSVDPTHAADLPDPDSDDSRRLTSMLTVDPPRHDELRDIVADHFTPAAVAALEPTIQDLARDLLTDAVTAGPGELDIVDALATPLPVTVIAELMGIPVSDRDRFKQWSDSMVAAADGADVAPSCGTGDAQSEMLRYFLDLLEDRRQEPGDDLLSTLVRAEADDGTPLGREAVLGTCVLLLVAGNITTTNLIANAVRTLTDEGYWAALAEWDDQEVAAAIEEVLRYRSPVQAMTRFATQDVTLDGRDIDAGDRLAVWLGSANRDPQAFEAPDAFRPDRRPTQHLAFGHGTHYCLGAPLGRLETRVALAELAALLEGVTRVDADLTPVRSSFIYGVESLPIRYGAVSRPA